MPNKLNILQNLCNYCVPIILGKVGIIGIVTIDKMVGNIPKSIGRFTTVTYFWNGFDVDGSGTCTKSILRHL
jgi:hypothetical protein